MGGDEVLPFLAGLGKSEQRERSEQKKFDTVLFRSYRSFSVYATLRPYSKLLARILNLLWYRIVFGFRNLCFLARSDAQGSTFSFLKVGECFRCGIGRGGGP